MRETNTTSLLRAATQAEEDAMLYGVAFVEITCDENGLITYEALDPRECKVTTERSQPTDRQYPDWERGKYPFSSHHRLSEISLHPAFVGGEWM